MKRLPITPDDPRHGSPAGYLAHFRSGEKPCEPCRHARYRAHKAAGILRARGISGRVPISPDAWRIVTETTRRELAAATGLTPGALGRIERRGPQARVLRTTHEAILGAAGQVVTPIGLQRRLRALSVLGWSMREIADRYPGANMDALKELRGAVTRQFVTLPVARQVVAAYRDLSMTPAPRSISSSQTRTLAAKHGYLSPLAWDDDTIDRPESQPLVTAEVDDDLDEAAIFRRMHGDQVKLTKAEQFEVLHRCLAANWGFERIETVAGLNANRLLREEEANKMAAQGNEAA